LLPPSLSPILLGPVLQGMDCLLHLVHLHPEFRLPELRSLLQLEARQSRSSPPIKKREKSPFPASSLLSPASS
jgi:hypothetical protein